MTKTCPGYIPDDYDSTEPDVLIEFDEQPAEPPTFDSPGCVGSIEITRVTYEENGEEIDLDCEGLLTHLESCVDDYLEGLEL